MALWAIGATMTAGGCGGMQQGVSVIAHRGDSGRWPENTLEALRAGVESGAELVELDARETADGVLVVIHDESLARTTDCVSVLGQGDHRVADLPSAVIATLDAGAWKDVRFAGARVPLLRDALATINVESTTLLEGKSGSPARYAEVLRETGQARRTVVQSFDWKFLAALRALMPRLRMAGLGEGAVTAARIDALRAIGVGWAGWNHRDLDEAAVARFHDAGIAVWAYTANRPREWDRLARIGVDGIITDHPETCIAWLASRGRR